jgi:hypothetical protein
MMWQDLVRRAAEDNSYLPERRNKKVLRSFQRRRLRILEEMRKQRASDKS